MRALLEQFLDSGFSQPTLVLVGSDVKGKRQEGEGGREGGREERMCEAGARKKGGGALQKKRLLEHTSITKERAGIRQ